MVRLPKKLIAEGNKLFGHTNWSDGDGNGFEEGVTLYDNPQDDWEANEVASIGFEEMPGCCGIVIFTNLQVNVKNKGYGEFVTKIAEYYAADNGYTLAIATTNNKAGAKIALALGATEAASFTNRKTRHPIKVWTKKLPAKTR